MPQTLEQTLLNRQGLKLPGPVIPLPKQQGDDPFFDFLGALIGGEQRPGSLPAAVGAGGPMALGAVMSPKRARQFGELMIGLMDEGRLKNSLSKMTRHVGDQYGMIKTVPLSSSLDPESMIVAADADLPNALLRSNNDAIDLGSTKMSASNDVWRAFDENVKNPAVKDRSGLLIDPEQMERAVAEGASADLILAHEMRHGVKHRQKLGTNEFTRLYNHQTQQPGGYSSNLFEADANRAGLRFDKFQQREKPVEQPDKSFLDRIINQLQRRMTKEK